MTSAALPPNRLLPLLLPLGLSTLASLSIVVVGVEAMREPALERGARNGVSEVRRMSLGEGGEVSMTGEREGVEGGREGGSIVSAIELMSFMTRKKGEGCIRKPACVAPSSCVRVSIENSAQCERDDAPPYEDRHLAPGSR